jgi:hypothetical protein
MYVARIADVLLERYADLIVSVGANVQPDQVVSIEAAPEAQPLASSRPFRILVSDTSGTQGVGHNGSKVFRLPRESLGPIRSRRRCTLRAWTTSSSSATRT